MKLGTITLAQLKSKLNEVEKPVIVKQDNKQLAKGALLKRKAQIKELGELLHTTYPGIFNYENPKPLAIGIDKIIALQFSQFSHKTVRFFMLKWVKNIRYLKAMTLSEQRFDLDNKPCGLITEEHKKFAQDLVDKKKPIKAESEN